MADDDLVICADDIAPAGALRRSDRVEAVSACPGRKLLVRRNHDFTRKGRLAKAGAEQATTTLLLPGDPPRPGWPSERLRAVHHHAAPGLQHINVPVERMRYAAVRVGVIRRLVSHAVGFLTQ